MTNNSQIPENEDELAILTREKTRVKKPRMYAVIMLNDDYTPMEFVIYVLQIVFKKSIEDATRMMLQVHQQGQSKVGVYTWDIANTKVSKVQQLASQEKHPLQCTIEPE